MNKPLACCPFCACCARMAARTGLEALRLCAALLRTVPAHDEAGPLCRKLAEWIGRTVPRQEGLPDQSVRY